MVKTGLCIKIGLATLTVLAVPVPSPSTKRPNAPPLLASMIAEGLSPVMFRLSAPRPVLVMEVTGVPKVKAPARLRVRYGLGMEMVCAPPDMESGPLRVKVAGVMELLSKVVAPWNATGL